MDEKINNIQTEALTRQASSRTYRLIDLTDQSCGGTVIAINIDEQYFLATAAHVIPKDHKFQIVLKNDNIRSLDTFLSHHINEEADVGLLEISKEDHNLIDSWLKISEINTDIDQRKENNVVVVGYPGQYIIRTPQKKITESEYLEFQVVNALCYLSYTLPFANWPVEGMSIEPTKGKDIFVDYDPDGEMFSSPPNSVDISSARNSQCPELPGMSGGGIWLLTSESNVIWKPAVKLAGIQHRAFKKKEWMRGTLIEVWLDLVSKEFPHLQSFINQK